MNRLCSRAILSTSLANWRVMPLTHKRTFRCWNRSESTRQIERAPVPSRLGATLSARVPPQSSTLALSRVLRTACTDRVSLRCGRPWLAEVYEREIKEARTHEERDYAMEDAEEAFYGDRAITLQEFETLKALFERLEKLG